MAFNVTVDSNNVLGTFVKESGKYNVRVSDSSEAKVSSSGKEMAVLDYEVLEGPYAGGKIRFDNVVWDESSPEAIKRSEKSFNTILVAAGVADGTKVNSVKEFVKGMAGKIINITTEWEKYNGNVNLRVKAHNEPNENGNQPSGVTSDQFLGNGGNAAKSQGGFSNKQAANPTPDPFSPEPKQQEFNQFAKNDGGEIDISDSDLPF